MQKQGFTYFLPRTPVRTMRKIPDTQNSDLKKNNPPTIDMPLFWQYALILTDFRFLKSQNKGIWLWIQDFSLWLETFERFNGQKLIFGHSHGNLGFPIKFIPVPEIPGNSGNGNGNSYQFPFPAHLWLWRSFYTLNPECILICPDFSQNKGVYPLILTICPYFDQFLISEKSK